MVRAMYITEVAVTSHKAGGRRMRGEYGPTGSSSVLAGEVIG